MVIFCIGSPEISGDSVAPLVGDILIENDIDAFVYGTTARPITASCYNDYYSFVKNSHPHEAIVAIDASLGNASDIGSIRVLQGSINPGRAIGRTLPPIGDIGVMAQVGSYGESSLQELMSVPYPRAIALANRCARIILSLVED